MKHTYWACDTCNIGISVSATDQYRYVLSVEKLYQTEAPIKLAVEVLPPLNREYHFCCLTCLKEFVDLKYNPNA